jgi:hypothetical protein
VANLGTCEKSTGRARATLLRVEVTALDVVPKDTVRPSLGSFILICSL